MHSLSARVSRCSAVAITGICIRARVVLVRIRPTLTIPFSRAAPSQTKSLCYFNKLINTFSATLPRFPIFLFKWQINGVFAFCVRVSLSI